LKLSKVVKNCKYFNECHSPAITLIQHTRTPVCKAHFLKNIESRVKQTIKEYNLIDFEKPDKILVAISGGKDSQTLLTILDRVLEKKVHLEAFHMELGITPEGYSHESAVIARRLCEKLNIPFHYMDIKQEMGINIDEIHEIGKNLSNYKHAKGSHFRGECSYCGLIKRYYINRFAALNGFTKVATGHNLTDESTQLISNFFTADIELMTRAGPSTITEAEMLVPRVKPLYFIYENEMILYAYYAQVEHVSTECPYVIDSPMMKVKGFMQRIEGHRRGTMINMLRKYQTEMRPVLFKAVPPYKLEDHKCNECGMSTFLERCAFCKTKERILADLDKIHSKSPQDGKK
jgi:uncharacterized protein (TIGR00269 family)